MSTMTASPRIVLLEETCARRLASEEGQDHISLSFYTSYLAYICTSCIIIIIIIIVIRNS